MLSLRRVGPAEPADREVSERKGGDKEARRGEPTRRFARDEKDVRNKELQEWGNRETAESGIVAAESAAW